jgi:hypothetical protein
MKKVWLTAFVVLFAAGCSFNGIAGEEEGGILAAESAERSIGQTVVERIADGAWVSSWYIYGYERIWVNNYSVWVDIKVENLAYHKNVGIVWTVNNWATNNVSYAEYEHGLDGNFEQWGIDLGSWSDEYYSALEYAIFVEMDGVTYWDNNNGENYLVSFQ